MVLLLMASLGASTPSYAQASLTWGLVAPTQKIAPDVSSPPSQIDTLHAARGEYAPFQIFLHSPDSQAADITVSYPQDVVTLQLYAEQNLPLPTPNQTLFYARSFLSEASALPDALAPLPQALSVEGTSIVWAELFVLPDAAPGEYPLTVTVNGESQDITLVVYPVDMPQQGGVSVIVPLSVDWTLPTYANLLDIRTTAYHQMVNQSLLDHYLISGHLVGLPAKTDAGWDFSAFDAELAALPQGAQFLAPLPYDESRSRFLFNRTNGNPYRETDFSDADFVAELEAYFEALYTYLESQGRLDGAWLYPIDERAWVADEPWHDGVTGYTHLAEWTALIRQAGLRVIASGVTPAPYGDESLGWLPGEAVTDNVHVQIGWLDANPNHVTDWVQQQPDQRGASVYLNEYGDMVNMPAAIHRGFFWHIYGRDVHMLMGYAALEWVTDIFELVEDPLTDPELSPEFGYGVGALLYPNTSPSLRVKWLREGVEDSRLLDLYGETFGAEAAQAFALCLTPDKLSHQTPSVMLWDQAHQALLQALSDGVALDDSLCLPAPSNAESRPLFEFSEIPLGDWDVVSATIDYTDTGSLSVVFEDNEEELANIGYWLGRVDLRDWETLEVTVTNPSASFVGLDVGFSDIDGEYILLENGGILMAPEQTSTIRLDLATPPGETFNWQRVVYLTLEVNTRTEHVDSWNQLQEYQLATERTVIFEQFQLGR